MQEIIGNTKIENNISSVDSDPQHDKTGTPDDTDADAFAILSLLLIIVFTIVYYLGG